ncbi:MAG TPA: cytochrome P450 [Pseudonocardiaceae bacterium]|nr:cytochrome P450 [Pseudonocardiaceae bacterium]
MAEHHVGTTLSTAWTAARYQDVRAVLSDDRFEVAAAPATAAVGTVAWLRASVSRFTNGPEHGRRRARLVRELDRLDPVALRSAATGRADAALRETVRPGGRIDVMSLLARRIPVATMAAALGIANPTTVAAAVISTAAGYFPGATAENELVADAATTWLVGALAPAELDVIIARITLLVQGCDATAGLIDKAVHAMRDSASVTTDALLAEVLRHGPRAGAIRRVARADIDWCPVAAGDTVVCDIDAANRDPDVFKQPDRFDPERGGPPSLTFGYGIRPCPGQAQALALAAGVVDAVRAF